MQQNYKTCKHFCFAVNLKGKGLLGNTICGEQSRWPVLIPAR